MLLSLPWTTALGVSRPMILRTLASGAQILIGSECGMSGVSICAAKSIQIGNGCLFGADVMIVDTDFHGVSPEDRRDQAIHIQASRPVKIGDNVFVGARTIILKGVQIGSNSVIGAGSVVTASIPANVIAAGNPCRVIRPLDNP